MPFRGDRRGLLDPNAARKQGLVSDIQQSITSYESQSQVVNERRAAVSDLDRVITARRNAYDELKQATVAYIAEHKMAVAAIAAGVAGTEIVSDPNNEFTSDQRLGAGIVAIIAAAYALDNAEEIVQVADRLSQANQASKSLRGQLDAAVMSRGALVDQLAAAEGELQAIATKRQQLRASLDALT